MSVIVVALCIASAALRGPNIALAAVEHACSTPVEHQLNLLNILLNLSNSTAVEHLLNIAVEHAPSDKFHSLFLFLHFQLNFLFHFSLEDINSSGTLRVTPTIIGSMYTSKVFWITFSIVC